MFIVTLEVSEMNWNRFDSPLLVLCLEQNIASTLMLGLELDNWRCQCVGVGWSYCGWCSGELIIGNLSLANNDVCRVSGWENGEICQKYWALGVIIISSSLHAIGHRPERNLRIANAVKFDLFPGQLPSLHWEPNRRLTLIPCKGHSWPGSFQSTKFHI